MGLTRSEYAAYIRSEAWRAKRAQVFSASPRPYRCHCCNRKRSARRPIEVHHLTYENLGAEPLTDLVLVCLICHGLIHAYAGAQLGLNIALATEYIRAARMAGSAKTPFGPRTLKANKPERNRRRSSR